MHEISDEDIRAWVESATTPHDEREVRITIAYGDRWPGEVEVSDEGVFWAEVRALAVETIQRGAWGGRRDWPVLARVVQSSPLFGRSVLRGSLTAVQVVLVDDLPILAHPTVLESVGFVIRQGRRAGLLGPVKGEARA